jgi:hypothetical protein
LIIILARIILAGQNRDHMVSQHPIKFKYCENCENLSKIAIIPKSQKISQNHDKIGINPSWTPYFFLFLIFFPSFYFLKYFKLKTGYFERLAQV